MDDDKDSLKVYRDLQNVIDTAEKKGKAEGKAEGLAEGMEKGKAEGLAEAARNMKQLGMGTKAIRLATGLDEEEIRRL